MYSNADNNRETIIRRPTGLETCIALVLKKRDENMNKDGIKEQTHAQIKAIKICNLQIINKTFYTVPRGSLFYLICRV